MNLTETLFWDTDISKLDYDKNARHIIERVIHSGMLSDWHEIKLYYPELFTKLKSSSKKLVFDIFSLDG